jgi:hypothetical protein
VRYASPHWVAWTTESLNGEEDYSDTIQTTLAVNGRSERTVEELAGKTYLLRGLRRSSVGSVDRGLVGVNGCEIPRINHLLAFPNPTT